MFLKKKERKRKEELYNDGLTQQNNKSDLLSDELSFDIIDNNCSKCKYLMPYFEEHKDCPYIQNKNDKPYEIWMGKEKCNYCELKTN